MEICAMPQLRRRLTLFPSPQASLRSQQLQVWLPNGVLMRCQIGCAAQQQQQKQGTRRAGRSGQSGEVERGVRASVRITLNHALTMSQGPAAVPSLLSAACCLAKTNLAAILCFKCRIVLPLLLLPSPAPLCATTSLRYFRSAAANEFLFASDSSGVKSSCVHEFFSSLSPAMRLRAHVLIRFHSPIIT